jgi:hypothetical protein
MTHPGHARRLRLERAERNGDLATLRRMDREATEHSRDPRWRRTVAAALRRVERQRAESAQNGATIREQLDRRERDLMDRRRDPENLNR